MATKAKMASNKSMRGGQETVSRSRRNRIRNYKINQETK